MQTYTIQLCTLSNPSEPGPIILQGTITMTDDLFSQLQAIRHDQQDWLLYASHDLEGTWPSSPQPVNVYVKDGTRFFYGGIIYVGDNAFMRHPDVPPYRPTAAPAPEAPRSHQAE